VQAVLKGCECLPCNIALCLSNSHESHDDDSMPNSQDDDIMMMCLSNSHESKDDDSMTNSQDDDIMMMCLSNSHESHDDDSMPNSQDDDIMMMCLSNSHCYHNNNTLDFDRRLRRIVMNHATATVRSMSHHCVISTDTSS